MLLIVCRLKSIIYSIWPHENNRYRYKNFGLTTAELLVAQNLGDRYRFIFVNTVTGHTMELKLNELFAKAKGIYPQWSISF